KSTTEGAKAHHNKYQSSWKNKFNWISYDTIKDKVFCDTCCSANRMQLPLPATSKGFSNWKKAIEWFGTHEKSNLHRAAVSSLGAVKAGVNVAAACSEAKQKQMKEARSALIKILSSVQYLSCQGLSVRGHTDEESNLNQLLALRAEDIPDLKSWLYRTKYRWISHDIVNEMIEIMAHDILCTLMKEIHEAGFFSIIMDETTDISVREQVSICFRIVNKDFDTEEIFFGFYNTSDTTSQTLYTLLKDVLLRFDFPLEKCRGQCYDGATNVAGCRRGLQALVQEDEPRAVYVHCLAHTVNLVVQDVAQNIVACRNFLTLIHELISLVKNSPKCLAWFEEFQRADKETLQSFCPTRWTLRAALLQSELSVHDKSDAGGKANGFLLHLQKFDTYFTLMLLLLVFSCAEKVNTALQSHKLHFHQAELMIKTLKENITQLREGFTQFWSKTSETREGLDLESPSILRPRKVPRHFDDGALPHTFQSLEELYRQKYYEVIDCVTNFLCNRFTSSVFTHMTEIEKFVIGKGDCENISNFYKNDIDKGRLQLDRDMFLDIAKQCSIHLSTLQDVVDVFSGEKGKHLRQLLPGLTKLIKLALTVPVTSCTSERSFSSLRRIKIYLRSTMGQARLNHVAILHGHKHLTRKINLNVVANEFIRWSASRRNTF
uniref:TTF-type domain-containing protein n=1 Tax=Latimeria chalumnae TaxID=7897 RepID=H2ZVP5_LATCH